MPLLGDGSLHMMDPCLGCHTSLRSQESGTAETPAITDGVSKPVSTTRDPEETWAKDYTVWK